MAGKTGRSGRPPEEGQLYRFEFYFRYLPGVHPPELKALLEAISRARGRKRQDILLAALLGGAGQAQETAARSEDSEVGGLFDEMLSNF